MATANDFPRPPNGPPRKARRRRRGGRGRNRNRRAARQMQMMHKVDGGSHGRLKFTPPLPQQPPKPKFTPPLHVKGRIQQPERETASPGGGAGKGGKFGEGTEAEDCGKKSKTKKRDRSPPPQQDGEKAGPTDGACSPDPPRKRLMRGGDEGDGGFSGPSPEKVSPAPPLPSPKNEGGGTANTPENGPSACRESERVGGEAGLSIGDDDAKIEAPPCVMPASVAKDKESSSQAPETPATRVPETLATPPDPPSKGEMVDADTGKGDSPVATPKESTPHSDLPKSLPMETGTAKAMAAPSSVSLVAHVNGGRGISEAPSLNGGPPPMTRRASVPLKKRFSGGCDRSMLRQQQRSMDPPGAQPDLRSEQRVDDESNNGMGRGASLLSPSISSPASDTRGKVGKLMECGENDLSNEYRGGRCAPSLQLLPGDAQSASALAGKNLAGNNSSCPEGRDGTVDRTEVAPPSDATYPAAAPHHVAPCPEDRSRINPMNNVRFGDNCHVDANWPTPTLRQELVEGGETGPLTCLKGSQSRIVSNDQVLVADQHRGGNDKYRGEGINNNRDKLPGYGSLNRGTGVTQFNQSVVEGGDCQDRAAGQPYLDARGSGSMNNVDEGTSHKWTQYDSQHSSYVASGGRFGEPEVSGMSFGNFEGSGSGGGRIKSENHRFDSPSRSNNIYPQGFHRPTAGVDEGSYTRLADMVPPPYHHYSSGSRFGSMTSSSSRGGGHHSSSQPNCNHGWHGSPGEGHLGPNIDAGPPGGTVIQPEIFTGYGREPAMRRTLQHEEKCAIHETNQPRRENPPIFGNDFFGRHIPQREQFSAVGGESSFRRVRQDNFGNLEGAPPTRPMFDRNAVQTSGREPPSGRLFQEENCHMSHSDNGRRVPQREEFPISRIQSKNMPRSDEFPTFMPPIKSGNVSPKRDASRLHENRSTHHPSSSDEFPTFLPPKVTKRSIDQGGNDFGLSADGQGAQQLFATFMPPTVNDPTSEEDLPDPPKMVSLKGSRRRADVELPPNGPVRSCDVSKKPGSRESLAGKRSGSPDKTSTMPPKHHAPALSTVKVGSPVEKAKRQVETGSLSRGNGKVHDLRDKKDGDSESKEPFARKNHIHIKIPKVNYESNGSVAGSSQRKIKLRITCSPRSRNSVAAEKSGSNSAGNRLTTANPKKPNNNRHPSPRYDAEIESKAKQILAKARLRLKLSAEEGKDVALPQTSSRTAKKELEPKIEKDFASDSGIFTAISDVPNRLESVGQPAVLSESPVSVPSDDHLLTMHGRITNMTASLADHGQHRDAIKPKAKRMDGPPEEQCWSMKQDKALPEEITQPQAVIRSLGKEKPGERRCSEHDKIHEPTCSKKEARRSIKNISKKISSKSGGSALKCKRSRERKYKMDLGPMNDDTESSDSDSSRSSSSSSSSSSCFSSSTSLSSSGFESSSSSSGSLSMQSDSSSSSSSSSDSELSSSDDDSIGDFSTRQTSLGKCAKKNKSAKRNRCHRRQSSNGSFVVQPAPPKDNATTEAEIKRILREDSVTFGGSNCEGWVRRSSRQPSKSLLKSTGVRDLLDKLKLNDEDMVVLKLKKYLNDPDLPPVVMDATLDALEENTNCQALYIQNFNKAMLQDQMMHLLRILQSPKCRIWCLNIGETYDLSDKTWKKFARGLKRTKVTHMYASEHTITPELKEKFRYVIRKNRAKHNMHIDPNNLDIIVRCTHCWWNPINASVLQPFIKNSRYEHILFDETTLGLKGTTDGRNVDTI